MARVFIASPLRGDLPANQAYARRCMRDSLARGEAPFVPHLLYDHVPEERERAIRAALEMLRGCEVLAVYTDRGISSGMRGEIEAVDGINRERTMRAADMPLVIEYRELGGES